MLRYSLPMSKYVFYFATILGSMEVLKLWLSVSFWHSRKMDGPLSTSLKNSYEEVEACAMANRLI